MLMQIMRLIITGQIDGKNAGLLLYALQTASTNLQRTNFAPYLYEMVLDPKTVSQTPIGARIWDDSDFADEDGEEDEETVRVQVMEEAQRRARKKTALDKWAEAEADRLAAVGARQREAQRQADRQAEMREAQLEAERQQAQHAATTATKEATPTATETSAGRAVVAPPQPPGKRPSANVSLDEVREKVNAQIRKALPAIAAAQANRENGGRSG
jgi:hypothetical protein